MASQNVPKTAVFLSIRDKSTRLPGKSTKKILGMSTCEWLIARLKRARRPDMVVLTTSVDPRDESLCTIAEKAGIQWFRGSPEDKLKRYLDACDKFGIEFAVVVDGDDLFCSEEHIDLAIEAYRATQADFITQRPLPVGAASFGVRREALREVCNTKLESDTEVWGAYFTENPRMKTHYVEVRDPLLANEKIRMTLDYDEDFEFFRTIIEALANGKEPPSFREIMTFISERPQISRINAGAQAKYEANLQRRPAARWKS